MAMDDEVPGAVGTSASFALRLGQTIFSAASLLFMSSGEADPRLLLQPGILLFIVLGDWALAFLTLAAASSIAGIVDVLHRADETFCPAELCSRYQISAGLAFLSWFLSVASSLSNLWLLPSLTR